MTCAWCGEDAVGEVTVRAGKKSTRTVGGVKRENWTKDVRSPVCRDHKRSFESRGMHVHDLEKK